MKGRVWPCWPPGSRRPHTQTHQWPRVRAKWSARGGRVLFARATVRFSIPQSRPRAKGGAHPQNGKPLQRTPAHGTALPSQCDQVNIGPVASQTIVLLSLDLLLSPIPSSPFRPRSITHCQNCRRRFSSCIYSIVREREARRKVLRFWMCDAK